ncbi:unnamed protein product [Blepharisma stoltei]|uniref:SAM domain-containing protein n=1 Tax=Blepharisma stoltei TaxID=1481888 RepID=A0AAU9I7J7_9CILI|nr:unnamed protein product [Blepharisma stoltei]
MESSSYIEDINRGCRLGDVSVLQDIFQKFPQYLNQKDTKLGWAPLYRTVICGHEAASKLLLDLGADPNVKTNIGETALHQASANGQYKIAKMLLTYKADPNSQQNDGDTPLHLAAFKGDILMVKLLLKFNGDPNVSNYVFGRTPLHYAVDYGHKEVAMLLMKCSASTTIKDMSDKTPLDLAKSIDFSHFICEMGLSDKEDSFGEDFRNGVSTPDLIDPEPWMAKVPLEKSLTMPYTSERPTACTDWNSEKGGKLIPELKLDSIVSSKLEKEPAKISSHARSVSTLFEPDAEKSDCDLSNLTPQKKFRAASFGGTDRRPELYLWTVNYKIEELFDILVSAGYDDVGQMSSAMNSSMPITEKILASIGITKPGLIRRLLASLDEESRVGGKSTRRLMKQQATSFWKCCVAPAQPIQGMINTPSLRSWLDSLNLGIYYQVFIDAGYDDMEHNLTLMNTRWPITEEILIKDLNISKPGHRHRILSRLKEDALGMDTMKRTSGGVSSRSRKEDGPIEKTPSENGFCGIM